MPNVITGSQVIFWVIWVNAIFIFTLVLPHQASYIFPFKSGVTIFKMFKKITNSDDSSETDKKVDKKADKKADNAAKNAAAKKVQAVFREKRAAQLEDPETLTKKIDNRRNPVSEAGAGGAEPEKTGAPAPVAEPVAPATPVAAKPAKGAEGAKPAAKAKPEKPAEGAAVVTPTLVTPTLVTPTPVTPTLVTPTLVKPKIPGTKIV